MITSNHRDSVKYWKEVTCVNNKISSLTSTHSSAGEDVFTDFLDRMNLEEGVRILDVGVGFGRFIPLYERRKYKVFGIDIDENMIFHAQQNFGDKSAILRLAKAEKTDFPHDFFDALVCWAVFEELDQAQALVEMNRILREGGKLLITGKNDTYKRDDFEATKAEEGARRKGHRNNFTMIEHVNFEDFGFTPVYTRYCIYRGDFAKAAFVAEKPKRYYEYIFILKKVSKVKKDFKHKSISNTYSINGLERNSGWKPPKTKYGQSEAPMILLSGVYRSGTTILAQIIGSHPDIYVTYDSVKFLRFCLDKFDPVSLHGYELCADIENRITQRWGMKFSSDRAFSIAKQKDYANLYASAIMHLRDIYKPNASLYGEKNAVVWGRTPDFLHMFPNGKVIHIFRDPRDATASYKKITYEPGYAYLDCAFNCLHAMKVMPIFQKYFGKHRIMMVKLEEIIDETEIWARKIGEFLGVGFHPDMLDPSKYRSKDGKKWIHNSAFQPEGKTGLIKQTKRYESFLTFPERFFVELITINSMRKHGYPLSGRIPTKEEWVKIYDFFIDPFLRKRIKHFLKTGMGVEGYPSDPTKVEKNLIRNKNKQS